MLLLQDALTDAVLRVDGQREIDGQLYYGERGLSRSRQQRQAAAGSSFKGGVCAFLSPA
jgi:hypothetical protein